MDPSRTTATNCAESSWTPSIQVSSVQPTSGTISMRTATNGRADMRISGGSSARNVRRNTWRVILTISQSQSRPCASPRGLPPEFSAHAVVGRGLAKHASRVEIRRLAGWLRVGWNQWGGLTHRREGPFWKARAAVRKALERHPEIQKALIRHWVGNTERPNTPPGRFRLKAAPLQVTPPARHRCLASWGGMRNRGSRGLRVPPGGFHTISGRATHRSGRIAGGSLRQSA